jgi:hypothetical protein
MSDTSIPPTPVPPTPVPPTPSRLDRSIALRSSVPTPPSIDAVWAAIDASAATQARTWRRYAVAAAAALVAVGAGVFAVRNRSDRGNRDALAASIEVMEPQNVRVLRADVEVDGSTATRGDRIEARTPARVRIGSRVVVELDANAAIECDEVGVIQSAGRARYDVVHSPTHEPFFVRTASIVVGDIGTRFVVDVSGGDSTHRRSSDRPDPTERVLVTVEEGVVLANALDFAATSGGNPVVRRASDENTSISLAAGHGATFVGGRTTGPAWDLATLPTLSIEAEGGAVLRTNESVVLRVTMENPTDGWIALPERDRVRAPLWIDARGPDGVVHPIRVTDGSVLDVLGADGKPDGTGTGAAIAPRSRVSLRVRFDHTFASPGTYRLRAVYRAADAVQSPESPEVTVTVR